MECARCHFDNSPDSKFCKECGTRIATEKDALAPVTQTVSTPPPELATGSTFAGRYQIIEEIGRGGMGRVYKAFDTKIREKIALKLIKPEIASDRETIERFGNEIRLSRRIAHRNVCRMFDLGEAAGAHFITMEYVPGEDLKSMIRMSGQLGVGTAVTVSKQVCEGLAEAHRLGVVHRDLKPSNVMIDREGNARIMDFGIARSIKGKGMTGAGVMIGTPEYMSPEQVEGKDVDQRSDIYSLGVILYEMVTGRVPFEGDTPFTIGIKHKSEEPRDPRDFNSQIPPELNRLILKCLEKDREKRFPNAEEVFSELSAIESGIPAAEKAVSRRKPLTSKEFTVSFGLKKALPTILGLILLVATALVVRQIFLKKEPAPAASAKKSIAVLPFVDLSQAKDCESLCDGISETLINALTNIESLWVPARTSAFYFKGKTQDIREIGRKLGVDNVLEGSVQAAGDDLRITARISSVRDGRTVWSKIYSRKMSDLFAIQDDIAKAIVAALRIELLGEKGAPLIKNYTENLEAYRLYLQGRSFWNRRTRSDLIKSIGYFEQAIAVDPNYALAYAGLSDAYSILGNNGFWPADKAYPQAKAAALKALQIDDKLAEAHASLASIIWDYGWDFAAAEKEFKLALELNPGYATAHQFYAMHLANLGRFEEAEKEIKIARQLDPLSPRISANVGLIMYYARRYAEALVELNKALDVDPNHAATHLWIGSAYEATGKYEEAIKSYQRLNELSGLTMLGDLMIAGSYALMGKRGEARALLAAAVEYSKKGYFSAVFIASVFSALGDKEQAFAWLEKAFRERDPSLLMNLKTSPRFDPLHSDPRYAALLRKLGLEN